MKFLKTITERSKDQGGVKGLLHREVGGFEPARGRDVIHASDLTKDVEYCPREIRLYELLEKEQKPQWIPLPLRLTFDEGRMKQDVINNIYLRDYMVGYWKAPMLDIKDTAQSLWSIGPPDDTLNWRYIEPHFVDPVTKASGSIDGIVELPEKDLLHVVEIKIMGDKQFRSLLAPLAEHKLRTQFYLDLISRSDHVEKDTIDLSGATVLYWLRGHGVKDKNGEISPFKEFVVKADKKSVKGYFDKAHEVTESRATGKLPAQICIHQLCERAHKCKVAKECFSNAHSNAGQIG